HLLGKRILAFEALTPGRHDLARGEEHLDGALRVAPIPPWPARRITHLVELAHKARPALGEQRTHAIDLVPERLRPFGVTLPIIVHAPAEERAILYPNKRGLVRPVF